MSAPRVSSQAASAPAPGVPAASPERAGGTRSERGSVTILMIGVLAIACVLMLGAARLGAALLARARAETAADAAALAAADRIALGEGTAAARAAATETAAANGAKLVECECGRRFSTVTVEVPVVVLGGTARATSRAEVVDPLLG